MLAIASAVEGSDLAVGPARGQQSLTPEQQRDVAFVPAVSVHPPLTSDAQRLGAALANRYRIERQIGQGGMATVYLAHDIRHDRDVAIKVLHEDLGATLGPERFLAEIKTTAKLQHPHILPLLDSGEASGLLFYVMPFVAGETLRERLTRDTQLSIEDALRIARQVADALGAAHALGIIHRDIKPENILLPTVTGTLMAVLFDVARLMLRRSGGDVIAVLVHNWGRVLREKLGLEKR